MIKKKIKLLRLASLHKPGLDDVAFFLARTFFLAGPPVWSGKSTKRAHHIFGLRKKDPIEFWLFSGFLRWVAILQFRETKGVKSNWDGGIHMYRESFLTRIWFEEVDERWLGLIICEGKKEDGNWHPDQCRNWRKTFLPLLSLSSREKKKPRKLPRQKTRHHLVNVQSCNFFFGGYSILFLFLFLSQNPPPPSVTYSWYTTYIPR